MRLSHRHTKPLGLCGVFLYSQKFVFLFGFSRINKSDFLSSLSRGQGNSSALKFPVKPQDGSVYAVAFFGLLLLPGGQKVLTSVEKPQAPSWDTVSSPATQAFSKGDQCLPHLHRLHQPFVHLLLKKNVTIK